MHTQPLLQISVENFRSLRKVTVDLQPLTALVGPNGAGKTNLLSVIRFLGETARLDLDAALTRAGGFDRVRFRGASQTRRSFKLGVQAMVTQHATRTARDEYQLQVTQHPKVIGRKEEFSFKRVKGRGRRIKVSGDAFKVEDKGKRERVQALAKTSSALSTLPRLGPEQGGTQVKQLANLFMDFRVFEVDVDKARRPARIDDPSTRLATDGSNLAAFLWALNRSHPEIWEQLEDDLAYIVPGFRALRFDPVGGAAEAVALSFEERGLRGATPLADASFGTVRAMALLASLHDPNPPGLTCLEEVDHGLHPHAIDRIVKRMRTATERTQLLITSHSPTFVNRLEPRELVVCERSEETGESVMPAVDPEEIAAMVSEAELSDWCSAHC